MKRLFASKERRIIVATRRCCSGCSGNNNCYGALNCVPGPYNCGCRYPYYTGPCAQASTTDACGNTVSTCSGNCGCNNNCSNGCNHWWHPWYCGCGDYTQVQPDPNPPTPSLPPPPMPGTNPTGAYGFFNAVSPVTVAAGGVIPLQTNIANDRFFTNNNGSILIRRAGTYLITYTVQLPAGEGTASQYYLALNGTAINESALNTADDTAGAESYTAQVIVQAPANSTLTLNSSSAVSLETTALNPYSLTIVRLA